MRVFHSQRDTQLTLIGPLLCLLVYVLLLITEVLVYPLGPPGPTPNLLMKGECPFGRRDRQGQREDGREEVFWKHYAFYPTVKLFVLNEGKKKKRLRFF